MHTRVRSHCTRLWPSEPPPHPARPSGEGGRRPASQWKQEQQQIFEASSPSPHRTGVGEPGGFLREGSVQWRRAACGGAQVRPWGMERRGPQFVWSHSVSSRSEPSVAQVWGVVMVVGGVRRQWKSTACCVWVQHRRWGGAAGSRATPEPEGGENETMRRQNNQVTASFQNKTTFTGSFLKTRSDEMRDVFFSDDGGQKNRKFSSKLHF